MTTNVVRLETGGKVSGIIPRNLDELKEIAETILKSGLAPTSMRSVEQISIALMHGAELGLAPMQSLSKIAIINGRPSVWGDAIPALLLSKGFEIDEYFEGEGDNRAAICVVTRPTGAKIKRRFSVADAKQARLWGRQGPWQQYPDRMLQMRARSFASRDGAAEVLSGLYFAEEVQDFEPPKGSEPTVIDIVAQEVVSNTINEEQIKTLENLLNSDPELDILKFFKTYGIKLLKDLPASSYEEALSLVKKSIANRAKKKGAQ